MTKPTVYAVYEYLDGFPHLEWKPVRLYYLESERSLKWKKSSLFMLAYTEVAQKTGEDMMRQEGWYSFKFVGERP